MFSVKTIKHQVASNFAKYRKRFSPRNAEICRRNSNFSSRYCSFCWFFFMFGMYWVVCTKQICLHTLFPAAISLQFLFDEAQFIMPQFADKNETRKSAHRNYERSFPGKYFPLNLSGKLIARFFRRLKVLYRVYELRLVF